MQFSKSTFIERALFIWAWCISGIGFLHQQFFMGEYDSIIQMVNLAGDATIMLLALVCLRDKTDLAFIVSYFVISYASTCMSNGQGVVVWLNGSRNYFGLLFAPPVLRYIWSDRARHDSFVGKLDKHLLVFLILQAITMTYQFFRYGPGDSVGGIFGYFSGIASITIFCASFYLVHKRIDPKHFARGLAENWLYVFLLFPVFLNETKISLVLIVLYFLLQMPFDKKMIIRSLIFVPIVLFLLGVGVYFYMNVNKQTAGTDLFSEDFFVEYLLQDIDEAQSSANYGLDTEDSALPDVPRLTKIMFMPYINMEHPGHEMLGYGVGLLKGGSTLEHTDMYNEYDWLIIGTVPMIFNIYIQLGFVGSVWLTLLFISWFVRRPALYRKRSLNIQLFALAIILALLVYADYWREMCFSFPIILFFFLSWQEDSAEGLLTEAETIQ